MLVIVSNQREHYVWLLFLLLQSDTRDFEKFVRKKRVYICMVFYSVFFSWNMFRTPQTDRRVCVCVLQHMFALETITIFIPLLHWEPSQAQVDNRLLVHVCLLYAHV